ncbi:hypothetical protein [Flavobacterium sp.]|uniref:hypothetical protein n=1 Tax=Flavobacterium sp. TaxID=239 RepID=UPI0039E2D1ED
MKTIVSTLFATVTAFTALAQDVTTVNAASAEISDNLDLRAVASIFGEAANLEDFERRLNDPDLQISNLDLNNDNRVDYLRVIETVDGYTHLIVLQSVLGRDLFQDVATIEVERDARNNVQIQVVGNVYMYGPNYIYEPVYVQPPVIYTSFWVTHYRPYCSGWYWGYYPTYYTAWHPYPVFRYRRNVHVHINVHNHYNYVNVRRSDRAVALYSTRRSDSYANQYPNRSFQNRHNNVANRYELDQKRNLRDVSVRNGVAASTPRNQGIKGNSVRGNDAPVRNNGAVRNENNTPVRNNGAVRGETPIKNNGSVRSNDNAPVRNHGSIRNEGTVAPTRGNSNIGAPRDNTPRANGNVRGQSAPRENASIRMGDATPRGNDTRAQSAPRENRMSRAEAAPQRQSRMEAPRGNNDRGSQMAANRQNGNQRGSESRR